MVATDRLPVGAGRPRARPPGVIAGVGGACRGPRSDGRPLGLGASSPPSGAGFGHLRRGRSGRVRDPSVPLGCWRFGSTVGCRGGRRSVGAGKAALSRGSGARGSSRPKVQRGRVAKALPRSGVGTSALPTGRPRSGVCPPVRGDERGGETVLRDWWLARLGPSGRWACLSGWTRLGRGRGLALLRRWRVCRCWAWFADARRALSRLLRATEGGVDCWPVAKSACLRLRLALWGSAASWKRSGAGRSFARLCRGRSRAVLTEGADSGPLDPGRRPWSVRGRGTRMPYGGTF